MIAYLIDPFVLQTTDGVIAMTGTPCITEIEHNGDFRQIYELLSHPTHIVDTFQGVYLPDEDVIYVDDEGLFKGSDSWWLLHGFPNPIRGRGLVLGTDDQGDSTSPNISIETLRRNIRIGSANLDITADDHDFQGANPRGMLNFLPTHFARYWGVKRWGAEGTLLA